MPLGDWSTRVSRITSCAVRNSAWVAWVTVLFYLRRIRRQENQESMGKFFVSAGVGMVSGVICFFLSVAFLSLLLLVVRGVSHIHPDMTLTYKAAAPVAVLAAVLGFAVTLVRSLRRKSANTGNVI